MSKKIEHLVEKIEAGDVSGKASNQLLNEFFAGLDLKILRKLLRSDNQNCVASGAFILSELADMAGQLFPEEALRLLANCDGGVRFDALNVVLTNSGPKDGAAVASALHAIEDSEQRVRWKALDVACRLSLSQLEAAMVASNGSMLGECLCWLLRDCAMQSDEDLIARVASSDRYVAAFAVVAAARGGLRRIRVLEHIQSSCTNEYGTVAKYKIEDLSLRDSENVH